MQRKTWYYEKWDGRQASFYQIWSVKHLVKKKENLFLIYFNRRCWRKRGLSSNPLFIIPGFSLHFPWELSYGYLRFEGNGKIPLGRQGKRKVKERARVKKLQNILLLTVGFELMTSWLPDGRPNQFGHPDTWETNVEMKK